MEALTNVFNYTILATASSPTLIPTGVTTTSWSQHGGSVQVFRIPVPDTSSSTSFALSLGGLSAGINATVAVFRGSAPQLDTEDVFGQCTAPNALRAISWCRVVVAGGEIGVRLTRATTQRRRLVRQGVPRRPVGPERTLSLVVRRSVVPAADGHV